MITFNYDRSFEQFLLDSLHSSHPEAATLIERLNVLTHIPILHVYGSLGDLNPASPAHLLYNSSDAPNLSPDIVEAAAARIGLYHEPQPGGTGDAGPMIREVLSEAEVICFLGFAFHPINMRMLEFFGFGDLAKQCFACAYHMDKGELAGAKKLIPMKVQFGDKSEDALEFLRNAEVLL